MQGIKGQEGELFGVANLFSDLDDDSESSGTTAGILNRTTKMYQSFRVTEEIQTEEKAKSEYVFFFLVFW